MPFAGLVEDLDRLDMLLQQLDATIDFGFGFMDAQSKIVYDLSPAHRLELALVAGRSRLDRDVLPGDVNEVKDGRNSGQLANVGWRITASPSTVVTQRIALAANQFENRDPSGFALDGGGGRDVTWRADVVKAIGAGTTLEGGGQVQWQQRDVTVRRLFGPTLEVGTLQSYDETAVLSSAPLAGPLVTSSSRHVLTWSTPRPVVAHPWDVGLTVLEQRKPAAQRVAFVGVEGEELTSGAILPSESQVTAERPIARVELQQRRREHPRRECVVNARPQPINILTFIDGASTCRSS